MIYKLKEESAMINIIERLKKLVEKISPTASQVHIPVPISREDKVNKVIADYNLISSKLKEMNKEISINNNVASVDTNENNMDVYRGKSF